MRIGILIGIAILLWAVIRGGGGYGYGVAQKPPKPRPNCFEQTSQDLRSYGQAFNVNELIRRRMHDPDSFEYVKTNYHISSQAIDLTVTFRFKNGFGGTRLGNIAMKVHSPDCRTSNMREL